MSYLRIANHRSLCLVLALAGACATDNSEAQNEDSLASDDEHDQLIVSATGEESPESSSKDESSRDDDADETDAATGGSVVAPGEEDDAAQPGDSTGSPRPDAGAGTGAAASDTMYVKGRQLYTSCGEKLVLRGVNHPTLYIDRAGDALPEIAKTKANAVRLFWYANNDVPITEAEASIKRTIENGMVPILEMHDATGPSAWSQLGAIVSYWTSPEAVALIEKYQAHLIVNIANEAGPDAGQDYASFESAYRDAITKLRNAGIKVPIMIDASGWGRDYEVLLQTGPNLVEHDPEHNLILSWHAYDAMSRQQIAAVYDRAIEADLPLIVGEFANRSPNGGCGPALDYLGLIAEAQTRDIGWLAWSWGDNDTSTIWNGDCSEFDMTSTFSFDSLQSWGEEVAVSDANSLTNTALRPASLTSGSCN
jgi:mannan endo-1,4-beta-mannosidase